MFIGNFEWVDLESQQLRKTIHGAKLEFPGSGNFISSFGRTFLLLLKHLKVLLMAGLVGDVQKPGQKTAARLRAASLAKKSANQRVTISNPHTVNNQVNSANL